MHIDEPSSSSMPIPYSLLARHQAKRTGRNFHAGKEKASSGKQTERGSIALWLADIIGGHQSELPLVQSRLSCGQTTQHKNFVKFGIAEYRIAEISRLF